MKQILTLITILLLLISLPLVAQKNVVITGIVRDSLNQPMPGATVVIKDTQIATMCNLEGEYTITIPASKINKNMILVFSFIGCKSKELKLNLSTLKNTKKL